MIRKSKWAKIAEKATRWLALSQDELNQLSTRELLLILQFSRGRAICSCGKGYHCGDDVLSEGELERNRRRFELGIRVKTALLSEWNGAPREHVPSKAEGKATRRLASNRREKKAMRF